MLGARLAESAPAKPSRAQAALTKAAPTKSAPGAPPPWSARQAATLQRSLPPYFTAPADIEETPAYRYAQLSRPACEAELKRRRVLFRRERALGVLAPVRLQGPLNGIHFRGEGTDEQRAQSPHEIIDCRVILSLFDSTEILKRHSVVEVRHFSMYRLPPPSWPRSKPATRHLGGLAIDAGRFLLADGSVLDVDRDFHGAIDAKTCGPGAAPRPATPVALSLRRLLCDLVDQRLFTVVLTPNYDPPHKNHFHFELAPGKRWLLIH